MSQISTIRPGLLVSLKTTVRGNVSYKKVDIEAETTKDDGTTESIWETTRRVQDAAEQKKATEVRGKACSLIRSPCARSDFGLLCPDNRQDDLQKAVTEAQALVDEFNRTAQFTRIGVFVICGKVASTDAEAVRAIKYELSGLIEEMQEGIKSIDPERIREAANKARNVGGMLAEDQRAKLQEAIDVARASAKAIVKSGEAAATEVDEATRRKLEEYRTAFLDTEEPTHEVQVEAETSGRAIDFDLPEPEMDPTDNLSVILTIGRVLTVNPIDSGDDGEPEAPQIAAGAFDWPPAQLDLI